MIWRQCSDCGVSYNFGDARVCCPECGSDNTKITGGDSVEWQPIETAPKDGSLVLCCWSPWKPVAYGPEQGEVCLLRWKLNPRNSREYFGDPDEWDDYELADITNQPTHWLPLPDLP